MIQTFRLCQNKTLLNRDQSEHQRACSCLSPSLHTVRPAHTSGLTHHTLVSCEAVTNAQLHTSASARKKKDDKHRQTSIVRTLCSYTKLQIQNIKPNKSKPKLQFQMEYLELMIRRRTPGMESRSKGANRHTMINSMISTHLVEI